MSRITLDTKCRLCRAAGTKLFLKGTRCTTKCPIDKKGAVPPGMHGIKRVKKPTDYGIQLRAKQKAKRIYGVQETQFKNYYLKAKTLRGQVGDNLMNLLEKRLDNVIYESGLCLSRSHAKQIISHGQVSVNGKKMSVSAYITKKGDVILLNDKNIAKFGDTLRMSDKDFKAPMWLDLNKSKYQVSVAAEPTMDDISKEIDVNLIIEYYSR